MLDLLKKNPKYMIGAIVVHLFFIVLFGVSFHFTSKERAATAQPKTVELKTIDERLVEKELQKLELQDQQEEDRKRDAIRKREAEEKRLADLREKREQEQRREKERLALLEKKEQELKEKQRREQERLKELERKRKAEEEKQDKLAREKALREKIRQEQKRFEAEQQALAQRQAEQEKRQTIIDKYMNLIEAKIIQYWIKPPTASEGKVVELEVRLIPTGEVIHIELSKSSGDPVYDKSVLAAVKRASPLPLPPAETGLFDVFRDLHLPIRADKKT